MKHLGWITALVLLAIIAVGSYDPVGAQSGVSVTSSTQALTNCPTSTAGANIFCSGPDGWYVGSGTNPLVKLAPGVQGPPGPAGPVGATGQTGAQGVPGPTWSTCTGVTFTPTGVVNGIVVGTLTVTPANCK